MKKLKQKIIGLRRNGYTSEFSFSTKIEANQFIQSFLDGVQAPEFISLMWYNYEDGSREWVKRTKKKRNVLHENLFIKSKNLF